ncbi:MAG: hypothetical protein LUC22_01345 [Prevotella sp.]|nr:hypothetical protein [Prevotella sp.]
MATTIDDEQTRAATGADAGENTDTGADTGAAPTTPQPHYAPPQNVLTDEDINGDANHESYTEQYNRDNPIESDEAYQRRQKRVRNIGVLAAVADGLSSLANLYYTNKYAPSAYKQDTKTLTSHVAPYWQQMEAERAAAKDKWAQGAQNAKKLDEAHNANERNWRLTYQQYLANLAQKDYENQLLGADETRKKELQPYNVRSAAANASTAETDANNRQRQYDDAHKLNQAQINNLSRHGVSVQKGDDGDYYDSEGFRVTSADGKYAVYRYDGTVEYYATEKEALAQAKYEQQSHNKRTTVPNMQRYKDGGKYTDINGNEVTITGYDNYPALRGSNSEPVPMTLDQLNARVLNTVGKGGRNTNVSTSRAESGVLNPNGPKVGD